MEQFERSLLKDLKEKGHSYKNIDQIFEQNPLQPEEVEVILKWLPTAYAEDLAAGDTLVRSLMSARIPFDPALLIDIFENSDMNFHLKSGIALTLGHARTLDVSQWMRNKLLNEPFANENYGLVFGLYKKGGFETNADFMGFIKKIFDKYHSDEILKFFVKYGDGNDLLFLKEKVKTADKKFAKSIQKVIDKMSVKYQL